MQIYFLIWTFEIYIKTFNSVWQHDQHVKQFNGIWTYLCVIIFPENVTCWGLHLFNCKMNGHLRDVCLPSANSWLGLLKIYKRCGSNQLKMNVLFLVALNVISLFTFLNLLLMFTYILLHFKVINFLNSSSYLFDSDWWLRLNSACS